jgi:hypothetical protein
MVGLTFAAFGILHAVVQAFFTEPTTRRFGERGAILLGVACDCAAFVAMGLITKGWMVFAIMILNTDGGQRRASTNGWSSFHPYCRARKTRESLRWRFTLLSFIGRSTRAARMIPSL